jgi:hypothetical protein
MALCLFETPEKDLAKQTWRSVRPGKIAWNEDTVRLAAWHLIAVMPEKAVALIRGDLFKGGALVKLLGFVDPYFIYFILGCCCFYLK